MKIKESFLWLKKSQNKSENSRTPVNNLLPIGSIVLLKDGDKRLMVHGILQVDKAGKGKEYDYIGILYPEGWISPEHQYLFNHEDINEIIFRGFEDAERTEFIGKLRNFCND